MAAPYNPPVKNQDFIFMTTLEDYALPGNFKVNPTIASGDFNISKDGGAFGTLTTLPSVAPAGSVAVKVTLSSDEMNADYLLVTGIDQTSPKEWADFSVCIVTTSA